MKKLTIFRGLILLLFTAFISVNLWGQSLTLQNPALPNSESNPYVIGSTAQWNTFAHDVTYLGYSYAGKYIKLTADIEVNQMVGGDTHPFSGTFDGRYNDIVHTLTFNYNGDYGIAPFYQIYGATIKNLRVAGNIVAAEGWTAGLLCYNEAETYLQNITVSVNVIGQYNDVVQLYCGGFVFSNANKDIYDNAETHDKDYALKASYHIS